jgi:RNA polymerase-binding transcription factor DksA
VTELKYAVPTGAYYGRQAVDLDAVRADLEEQRQFRVEQLKELAGDMLEGSDGALDEVTSALMTGAAAALADIDAALHRIELGCFGLCQRCDDVIALDRLKVLPMAGLCMFCQYAKETSGPLREQAPSRPSGRRHVPPRPVRNSPSRPARREPPPPDIVEVWGHGSFPASDPPANW